MNPATLVRFVLAMAWPGDSQRARARLGRAALRAKTVPEAQRRAVIASRLPTPDWPRQRLLITAVNAETGAAVVFDRDSGVSLVDAVAASCAVPLVWPPITIKGQRYIDGGMRSVANVDLAKGYERVVVIAPLTAAPRRANRPAAQAATLGAGVRSVIVSPERAARAAIGSNVLDPAHRAASAQAGPEAGGWRSGPGTSGVGLALSGRPSWGIAAARITCWQQWRDVAPRLLCQFAASNHSAPLVSFQTAPEPA